MGAWSIGDWAALAGIIGLFLATWTTVAPRFGREGHLMEKISLSLPGGRDLPPFDPASDDKNIYLQAHGTDLASLFSFDLADDRNVLKALRSLVKAGKVEGATITGVIEEGSPEMIGKVAILSVFFWRGISPSLRTNSDELLRFIQ